MPASRAAAPLHTPALVSLIAADGAKALVLALLVMACALVAVRRLNPPASSPASAPLTEFSSGRAMQHLRVIAQTPHPLNSPEHAQVRDYILHELTQLGLQPALQTTPVVSNILVRVPGTEHSAKAVLLVGHYDTVADSPGAADDGSAVVVLLETLRAIKASAPLRNDVIVLFSDGEEAGLLGAKAFAYGHAWAQDVGVVLNFEARGSGGPALMFETSGENGRLISEFAQAAPYPVAYSIAPDLYKLLPNSTDLAVFKEVGWPGLNFAFIKDGATNYHSPLDNLADLDERSVQHQGTYALMLARRFGDMSLADLHAPDAIYFNLFGTKLVVYSARWLLPLALLLTLLFVGLLIVGLRARRLSVAEIGKACAAVALGLLITLLGVSVVGWLAGLLFGDTGNADTRIALLGFSAIILAAAFYAWCGHKISGANLLAGGLVWWLLLLLLTSLFLPGGSYLFAWPLLFGLLALAFELLIKQVRVRAGARLVALLLCVLAGSALCAPLVYLVIIAFTLNSAGATFALVAPGPLVMILLAPYFARSQPAARTAVA